MARFPDELAALLAGEGVVVPDGFGDTLTTAYNDDITETTTGLNTEIGNRDKIISDLRAAAVASIPPEAGEPFPDDEGDDDEMPDVSFDDMFSDDPDDDGKWDGK